MISKLFLLFALSANAAPLKVLTSTTDIAWLARQIGGDKVQVTSLLKGTENPHYIDAVPDFTRRAAEAQVVCVVGLDLEVGWMPKVLSKSGNAKVQPGGTGYCEAARGITVLERQEAPVDRSMGDIHPSGNPHFWVSPDAFSESAKIVSQALIQNDGANAAYYRANLAKVQAVISETKKRNLAKLKPYLGSKGPMMVEYHKEFSYFSNSFGIESMGSLEEKPGITPSAGRIGEVAMTAKAAGVRFLLAGDTAPKKTVGKFSELSGIPLVVVPLSLRSTGSPAEYPEFIDGIVDAIVAVLKGGQDAVTLISAHQLAYGVPDGANGHRLLQQQLSFSVESGDLLLISGANGTGKSTPLRVLMGELPYLKGELSLGFSLGSVHYLPQLENTEVHLPLTLGDVLSLSLGRKVGWREISRLGLLTEEHLGLSWNKASGGERKRTLLTEALLKHPQILILDEPMNHLDEVSREAVIQAVSGFLAARTEETPRAIVMVCHQGLSQSESRLFTIRELPL